MLNSNFDARLLFEPPRYVTVRETLPTGGKPHSCKPGHCSQNPLLKPVKGCYRCSRYVKGYGDRPTCGHFDFVITSAASKNG